MQVQAYHVVLTTYNSRYSKRMVKYRVKRGKPIHLSLQQEIMLTKIIGEIIRENQYKCIANNICKDHVHMIIVCYKHELTGIMQKLKSISSKLFRRKCRALMEASTHPPRGKCGTNIQTETTVVNKVLSRLAGQVEARIIVQ